MKKRYVKIQNPSDISVIESLVISKDSSHNLRCRCQGILLSHRSYNVQEISRILEVRVATVYDWFNRYEAEGIEGLLDSPRSGRPMALTVSEQKKLSLK